MQVLDSVLTRPHLCSPMASQSKPRRSRPLLFWGIAFLSIVAGFADLARGGDTIAPVLLVLGYCVLVPIAILK